MDTRWITICFTLVLLFILSNQPSATAFKNNGQTRFQYSERDNSVPSRSPPRQNDKMNPQFQKQNLNQENHHRQRNVQSNSYNGVSRPQYKSNNYDNEPKPVMYSENNGPNQYNYEVDSPGDNYNKAQFSSNEENGNGFIPNDYHVESFTEPQKGMNFNSAPNSGNQYGMNQNKEYEINSNPPQDDSYGSQYDSNPSSYNSNSGKGYGNNPSYGQNNEATKVEYEGNNYPQVQSNPDSYHDYENQNHNYGSNHASDLNDGQNNKQSYPDNNQKLISSQYTSSPDQGYVSNYQNSNQGHGNMPSHKQKALRPSHGYGNNNNQNKITVSYNGPNNKYMENSYNPPAAGNGMKNQKHNGHNFGMNPPGTTSNSAQGHSPLFHGTNTGITNNQNKSKKQPISHNNYYNNQQMLTKLHSPLPIIGGSTKLPNNQNWLSQQELNQIKFSSLQNLGYKIPEVNELLLNQALLTEETLPNWGDILISSFN